MLRWAEEAVNWSACLPYTPMIQVCILLKPTVVYVKILFEKNKNKQKEAIFVGLGMKKTSQKSRQVGAKWTSFRTSFPTVRVRIRADITIFSALCGDKINEKEVGAGSFKTSSKTICFVSLFLILSTLCVWLCVLAGDRTFSKAICF